MWAAYYVPQNTYKAQFITLQVLRNLKQIPERLHIVIIGSGVGPTIWAIADLLRILKNIAATTSAHQMHVLFQYGFVWEVVLLREV